MTRKVTHPTPAIIAAQLERTATLLRTQGDQAIRMAAILAARGYPTTTLGNGSRGSDTTSSTERAAGLTGPDGPLTPPDPDWHDINLNQARLLRMLFWLTIRVQTTIERVMAHASDDDPIPAGTGPCALKTCEHFCNPRKNPHDRLVRGLCPSHHKRWVRSGKPDMAIFERMLAVEQAAT